MSARFNGWYNNSSFVKFESGDKSKTFDPCKFSVRSPVSPSNGV